MEQKNYDEVFSSKKEIDIESEKEKAERRSFMGKMYSSAYDAVPQKKKTAFVGAMKKLRNISGFIFDEGLEYYVKKVYFDNVNNYIVVSFDSDVIEGFLKMKLQQDPSKKVILYNDSDYSTYMMKPHGYFRTKHVRSVLMDVLVAFCCDLEEFDDEIEIEGVYEIL